MSDSLEPPRRSPIAAVLAVLLLGVALLLQTLCFLLAASLVLELR